MKPTFSGAPWASAGVGKRKAAPAVNRPAEPMRKPRRLTWPGEEIECDMAVPPAVWGAVGMRRISWLAHLRSLPGWRFSQSKVRKRATTKTGLIGCILIPGRYAVEPRYQ